MSPKVKQKERKTWFKKEQHEWWDWLTTALITTIITLPVFIILHRILPFPTWSFHFERILLFLALFSLFFYIFLKIKYFLWIITISLVALLSIGSLSHHYGFKDIFEDYRGLISNLSNQEKSIHDIAVQQTFPHRSEFIAATRFTPEIKSFANQCAQNHFKKEQKGGYRRYIQCFAIFKEINDQWQYVNDPQGQEYIATANESIKTLAGDCDDYTALMAACLKAIGAQVRIVRTPDHIYPELRFNNRADFDNVCYLIRYTLFKDVIGEKTIYYHVDNNDNIWLNMDYTEPFPGGYFLSEEMEATMEL